MKYARKSIVMSIVLMLSGILITTALAYPISNVTMQVVDGTDSYFLTTLSGIPAGEDISDGTYLGWCVNTNHELPRSTNHIVTLYSSLAPPASLASEAWDMVNYILNHKQGGKIDIQAAIWYFIKLDPNFATPGYFTYDPYGDNRYGGNPPSADTQAMVADALANGAGYTPGPGDVVAIICVPTEAVQYSIVELTVPELAPGFTPGFWKHNIEVRLSHDPYDEGLTKSSYSAFSGGPLDGVKLTDELMDSLLATVHTMPGFTTLTFDQALANLRLPGWNQLRTDTANAFNAAAGYGPF